MSYGADINVYVEDKAGDGGVSPSPVPWWLSPDVDIPAHSGTAYQGANQVQVRVHCHEEPVLSDRIVAEVYAGNPSLVMAPGSNAVRIDPGTLLFRTAAISGTEPIANETGATMTFSWTPSSNASAPDGPGHRCLILRAFPQSITAPTSPFDVPNEQHEAQHNIEVLATTKMMKAPGSGAGTPGDPRQMNEDGSWSEVLLTRATGRLRGRRYIVCAFDPDPDHLAVASVRSQLTRSKLSVSNDPPQRVELEADAGAGEPIDPRRLLKSRRFARASGLGEGLLAEERLLATTSVDLGPRKASRIVVRFDHSNLRPRTAAVLHVAQFTEDGRPEGGMTIVAVAPRDR
jgi:hypothetical protein